MTEKESNTSRVLEGEFEAAAEQPSINDTGQAFAEQALQLLEQARLEESQEGSPFPVQWQPPKNIPDRQRQDLRAAYQEHQYALDLFGEHNGQAPITSATREIAFKKNNYHIRMVGKLSLLERKIINALHFIARPNVLNKDFHRVSLSYLKWLINSTTPENTHLKRTIEKIQGTTVWIEEPNTRGGDSRWISIHVLGTVAFDRGVLYFKIPEDIRPAIANPEQFGYLSMRMNAVFNGKHSLSLYEDLVSWKWRTYTAWYSLEHFRKLMGVDKDEYTEFKRMSSRLIQDPLDEIKELADIKAEVEYRRENRKVVALRFKVMDNPEGKLALNSIARNTEFPSDLYDELKQDWTGSDKEINEIAANYSPDLIREKIKVLTFRYKMARKKMEFPGALLRTALDNDDNYKITQSELTEVDTWLHGKKVEQQKLHREIVQQNLRKKRSAEAESFLTDVWPHMEAEVRATYWAEFLNSPEGGSLLKIHKLRPDCIDLSKRSVEMALATFLQKQIQPGGDNVEAFPDEVPAVED